MSADRSAAPSAGGGMSFGGLLGLAWRESRTARRRLLLYMSSILLGVAALVAIDSFASNVSRSVAQQSRALVGGDVSFQGRGPFPRVFTAFLDSIADTRTSRVARVTTFASMGTSPRTQRTRLVQVRAVDDGYPFYGTVTTTPAGRWGSLATGRSALVDRSLLAALDVQVGDSLQLGYARFAITGVLENVPGDPGIAAVIGPRVYVPQRYLQETQLLGFGARAEYEAVVQLPPTVRADRWVIPVKQRFEKQRIRARTVSDAQEGITQAVDRLSDFLSIVGLIALLLGGVGVASGVSAFVARKIDTVAVLRCLGATSRQVLAIYVLQAGAMGLLGAAVGAVVGIALQVLLPKAFGDFLPVDVVVRLEPGAIATGLAVGLWVALVFALRPLLALRRVSPLQAIRRDVDADALRAPGIDWAGRVVDAAVIASVAALAVQRTGRVREGLAITAAIFVALALLWGSATVVTTLARRTMRAGWPYVVRQGVANLYRPGSQTRAVTLALGFGAFLVSTIYLVRGNLLRDFDVSGASSRANVLFFDVQQDQAAPLDSLLKAGGHEVLQRAPIVTMRVQSVNGRSTAQLLADTTRRTPPWPLRREYRSTYRATTGAAEKVTAGRFFAGPGRVGQGTFEVSLEQDLARDLGVQLGDTITWDVQGAPVRTVVTSLRDVTWARFEPNFFAVFQPAALQDAPQQYVLLAHVEGAAALGQVQGAVVQRFPNVASLDLSLVQRTVGNILDRVAVAVRFLGAFCLVMGVPVLISAVAATRRQRLRDAVLLKTLGATRAQIGRILLAEYTVLGVLGAAAGMALSFVGAWLLARFVFEADFRPAWGAALAIAAVLAAITVAIGWLTGREAFRETPMAALRES